MIHVHEIYRLPSKKFKEYRESGFLELAFLDGFTGNIDIYIYIYTYRGIDACSNETVEAIDAERKMFRP